MNNCVYVHKKKEVRRNGEREREKEREVGR